MNSRPLGTTGLEVGEVGLGTWELSGDVWGPKDDEESLAALRAGIEAGANFVDTAADYGNGHVESLIGRLLAEGVARDQLVICTKVRPQTGVWAPPPSAPIGDSFSPDWIRSETEASLRRLGTDHVDVLLLHTWSRAWGHHDDWYEAMAVLRAEGKTRAIGISIPDEGLADANVAIARGQVEVVQCVYSALQQEPEYTLFPLAARFGVGIVARSPFSSGALVSDWEAGVEFPPGDWRATWPLQTSRTGWPSRPGWRPWWRRSWPAAACRSTPSASSTSWSRRLCRWSSPARPIPTTSEPTCWLPPRVRRSRPRPSPASGRCGPGRHPRHLQRVRLTDLRLRSRGPWR